VNSLRIKPSGRLRGKVPNRRLLLIKPCERISRSQERSIGCHLIACADLNDRVADLQPQTAGRVKETIRAMHGDIALRAETQLGRVPRVFLVLVC
jgi:hypothetical protein